MTAEKWVVGEAFPVCVVDNSSNPLAGQECPHCNLLVRDFSEIAFQLCFFLRQQVRASRGPRLGKGNSSWKHPLLTTVSLEGEY